jgi:hypothetical protein
MAKYQILSPDGFTIEFSKEYYKTKKDALKSFENWLDRYKVQGFYSSTNYGKIHILDIKDYCQFIKI